MHPQLPVPRLSVVIPAYNRRESVLTLLADIFRDEAEGPELEVIVVDDCSTDGTLAAIRERFPRTITLRNEVNRGPAVTRNRGVLAARSEIVVGFDSDVTLPDAGLLRKVVRLFTELPHVDGLAFRILQPDGKSEDERRWWHPVPIGHWAAKRFSTSYFSGTAYAFRKNAVLEAGLFPEDIFMHYEEVELAYRVLDGGGNILYAPELVVLHHEHQVSRRSEVTRFYKPRNQVLLAAAHLPWMQAAWYLAPRLVFQFSSALVHGHLTSFFRALRSAAAMLPARLERRRPLKPATLQRIAALRSGIAG